MKTKSLLFAALVSISLATTSCQKEENIAPNSSYYSTDKITTKGFINEANTELIDGNLAVQQNFENTTTNETKASQPKTTTVPANIMQIYSDDIK